MKLWNRISRISTLKQWPHYKRRALIKSKQDLAIDTKKFLHEISTVSRDYVYVILFHRQNVLEVKRKIACIFSLFWFDSISAHIWRNVKWTKKFLKHVIINAFYQYLHIDNVTIKNIIAHKIIMNIYLFGSFRN